MALVIVLAGSWLGYRQLSEPGCAGQVRLTVAAANEIVPAVQQAANQWTAAGAEVGGTCVAVDVTAINPAAMASRIAKDHGVTLTGLGQASGSTVIPDVWIPDSSTWLQRLEAEASGFQPTDRRSIAQSPVVVAMPQPIAQQFGWPDKELKWSDLLSTINTGNSLRTGIVDPTRDAAGLAGLLALGASAGAGAEAQATTAGALRALAAGSSALRDDLLEKFPRSLDPGDIASSLSAAPLSEEDVVGFNGSEPPVQLAALYLKPAPRALDYPYAVLPQVDAVKASVADALRVQLESGSFKDALAGAGLRGPDGTVGVGFKAPLGAPQASPPTTGAPTAPAGSGTEGEAAAGAVDPAAISQALGSWAAITLPGRVLAVFDVSGSMLEPVPTAGNIDRADVTRRAAGQGLALFDDKWAVGVWVFSTELNGPGTKDYREIVPISPLSSKRSALQASIGQIVPKRGGGTGLYDTAFAAYKNVQDSYQAGRVNSVLLFTDGQDDDGTTIGKDELISQLKKTADPKRPVRLIIIGIGTGIDRKELQAVVGAVGGSVFVAEDPAKISSIFLQAISSRAGTAK
jgi:hypothetical protein